MESIPLELLSQTCSTLRDSYVAEAYRMKEEATPTSAYLPETQTIIISVSG